MKKLTMTMVAALALGALAQAPATPAGLKHLGVAYYPEVWPQERWAQDLDLMREVGFDTVRIGEFNWSGFEPREGEFDFSGYRAFLALCAEKGVKVVLCTPTAALPPWMRTDHPDTEKTGIDGTRPSLGGRQTYCPSSPELRRFSARIVTKMAEAFRDAPAVVAWQLDNELNVHGGTGVCHCRRCADGFRDFLRRRYGTLDKLNRELNTSMWSARFSKWEEITSQFGLMGRDGLRGIRAAWAREYLDYEGEAYFDLCREQARILRRIQPRWKITTNNPEASGTARYDRLYRELDFAACDTYVGTGGQDCGVPGIERVRWMWNMFRGMRGAQQGFTVAETGATNFNPSEFQADAAVRCVFWDAIFHGADSFFYFRWRQSVIGEDEHTAVLPWSGKPSGVFRRLKAQFDEARRSGLDVAALPPEPTPVAILHDSLADQHALARIGRLQGGPVEKTAIRLSAALERFGIVPDCLQMDADPDFTPYKLVLLPLCARVPDAVAAKLRAYVAAGGAVAAVTRLDDLTPYGGFVTEPYPLKLKDVFGLEINERRSLKDDHYHELLELKGAEPLLRFPSGSFTGETRLSRYAFGRGRALYLAETPSNESALEDVRALLDGAGIAHGEALPPSVRRLKRGNAVALINLSAETVRLPAERGETALGRHVVENGQTVLAPWDVVILR